MSAEDQSGGSAARSRAFYRAIGATGLAIRTTPAWDAQVVERVVALLPVSGCILDVGCGYGRIAVPLAERGYEVTGLDVSPAMLRAARRSARHRGVLVRFDLASMTAMPYPEASFDGVVSLWSAFHELLDPEEQRRALAEMHRVLRPGGVGIVDGPPWEPPADPGVGVGVDGPAAAGGRIVVDRIAGHRYEQYGHDARTLGHLAVLAGLDTWRVEVQSWAGRDRQLLLFWR